MMAGCVLTLLSIEKTEISKANYGYLISAISIWLNVILFVTQQVLTLFYDAGQFGKYIFAYLGLVIFLYPCYCYAAWLGYCYVKHLSAGNVDLVMFGEGQCKEALMHEDGVEQDPEM